MLRSGVSGILRLAKLPIFSREADKCRHAVRLALPKATDQAAERRTLAAFGKTRAELEALMIGLLPGHAANDAKTIGEIGLTRQQLADSRARHVRRDRPQLPTVLRWGVGLHVVGIELAGAPTQIDHDDRL